MTLRKCRLCGKVFAVGSPQYCGDCIKELGELYNFVHRYMRDHDDETFDIEKLSGDMNIDPAYIKALVDLGYIESKEKHDNIDENRRKKLAAAFNEELEKMQKEKVMFYGGEVYARKKIWDSK